MRKFNCLRDESMGRSLARRLLDPRIDLSSLRRVERRRLRRARRWRRGRAHPEGGHCAGGDAVISGHGTGLFDHLIGALLQKEWNIDPKRPSGLQVYYQLDLSRKLDWHVCGLCAL